MVIIRLYGRSVPCRMVPADIWDALVTMNREERTNRSHTAGCLDLYLM